MKKGLIGLEISTVGLYLLVASLTLAQQAPEMILYNGKIVTVDDDSFTSQIGSIAQAVHIKEGKITNVGTDAQIRAMAGPNTRAIDLGGRTVLPGIITTHDHPHDWDAVNPWILKDKTVIPEDVVVFRYLEGSPDENLEAFPRVLQEAVSKAKPGQWIYIVFTFGKKYQYGYRANSRHGRWQIDRKIYNILDGTRISKQMLDTVAPNNPVVLRDVFVDTQMNQRAIEKVHELWADYPSHLRNCISEETGVGVSCGLVMRWSFPDLIMRDFYQHAREVSRLGLEWWAGYGNTTFSSFCYNPRCVMIYDDLNRSGQMAIRQQWGWGWETGTMLSELYTRHFVNAMRGYGSDYLWFGAFSSGGGGGGDCTAATVINPEIPMPPISCSMEPGSEGYKRLYNYIKAGGRYATHTVGDKDIDNLLDIIEKASAEAGMTLDQIRAKRHAFDHGALAPRPDQIDRIKRLGLIAGANPAEIHETSPTILAIYGERAAGWIVPKKRLADAGIYNTFEFDRAMSSTDFTAFTQMSQAKYAAMRSPFCLGLQARFVHGGSPLQLLRGSTDALC